MERLILAASPSVGDPDIQKSKGRASTLFPVCLYVLLVSSSTLWAHPPCDGYYFHPSPTPELRFFYCLTWTVRTLFLLFLFTSWSWGLPCYIQLSWLKPQSQRVNWLWTRTSKIPSIFTCWWSPVICYSDGKLTNTPKEYLKPRTASLTGMSLLFGFYTKDHTASHHCSLPTVWQWLSVLRLGISESKALVMSKW